ncbi:MAG TPA: hypothetical protein VMR97_07915 [Acidimicrobiales bacterium]|nr:hypothetical protein [Acidimicrobiales bacterium]
MARTGWLGALGIMLSLIALFLVLEYAGGATGIIGALASGAAGVFGTLQGRTVSIGGTTVGQPSPAQST